MKIDLPEGLTIQRLNEVLHEVKKSLDTNQGYGDDVTFTSRQGYELAMNHPIELVEAEKMADSWILKFRKKG